MVAVRLDEDAETELDCRLSAEPAVVTRRKVRSAVPAGEHTATIRLTSAGHFYFDFLEAAIPSDVPDARPALAHISPALDYSTDHTYKLPPARILWMFDQLGFAGPMNEYIGVFWWNQRQRVGAVIPSATVTFEGQFLPDDQVFLSIGGQTCGKTVFPNEDGAVLAGHFAHYLNSTYVGVWAAADGECADDHGALAEARIFVHVSGVEREFAGVGGNGHLDRQPSERPIGRVGGGPRRKHQR